MLNLTKPNFVLQIKKIAPPKENEQMRAISYSMDLLIPGSYIWFPGFSIRIGGSIPDDLPYKYPRKIHSPIGIALVLPGYKIFTAYQGTYDPREAPNTRNTTI
ncbi:hypothetical protein F7734_52745 [Scytonema sp. UIC 10036]|uniref:hypothetical protein n=1 Tax=Scytonema sp. UIC 10036 TaxID=2304196 RepID=UPI0012DAA9CB|nr:hypothetical protein [Scytonema sp. UIC 10036]MUH00484.1 hypothetical protein [Scytonema sp. UIC 10036]